MEEQKTKIGDELHTFAFMHGVLKIYERKIQISAILSKSIWLSLRNVLVLKKSHVNFMDAGFDKKDSREDNIIKAKQNLCTSIWCTDTGSKTKAEIIISLSLVWPWIWINQCVKIWKMNSEYIEMVLRKKSTGETGLANFLELHFCFKNKWKTLLR